MKVVIDSYELLGVIGQNRKVFGSIHALVTKQASALLTAQLKHKSLDLSLYRMIVVAIGEEPFELFLDLADDKLLKAIAKKLDPHSTATKAGDGDTLRPHLIDLAAHRIEPATKPRKAAGGAKKPSSTAGGVRASEERLHAIATKPPGRK